jgi:hypothetical protein
MRQGFFGVAFQRPAGSAITKGVVTVQSTSNT